MIVVVVRVLIVDQVALQAHHHLVAQVHQVQMKEREELKGREIY